MLKEKKFVMLAEYIIGFLFLAAVMPFIVHPQPGWSPSHGWAYLLFMACTGITLLSSASAMRHRIKITKHIKQLEQTIDDLKNTQSISESAQKHTPRENFISSLN